MGRAVIDPMYLHRPCVEMEWKAVEEGHRLRAAAYGALTLAIDVSYLNIGGTFYYLCSILDGFSRYIVNSRSE